MGGYLHSFAVISDFFFDMWFGVIEWALTLLPEHTGLPTEVIDAVNGVGSLFSATGGFFGALDHWFPVGPFLAVAGASIVVEIVIATIRGIRVVKQLLPFQ